MPKGNNSNTTDKLVIDIKVNVKKGATTQITNLTKSLTQLNEVVKKTANIEAYANALRTIGKELTKTTSNKGISKVQENANLLETQEVSVAEQKQLTKETQKQVEAVDKVTREKQKQLDLDKKSNAENKKSSTFFSKFARSIGRIALYRAIRASLSGIVKMFQEGLTNLRAFDETTDKSFKKMELSATTFKNSIASLATGLIQGIQPYITQITDTIGNMVNRFNEAQAVLKGSDTYMKVLTSDTKEWQEQVNKATGSLLEFDKFLSLNQKENGYTGFVTGTVSMSVEEANKVIEPFENAKQTITEVMSILRQLWQQVIVPIWELLQKLFPYVEKYFNYWVNTGFPALLHSLQAIVDVISFLVDLITLDFTSAWDKIKNMNFNDWFVNQMKHNLSFLTFGLYQPYADGGMVEKGTSFIAGEAGAEVVHTSARGTGVTNIEQFSQAMLQALATYGVARGSDVSFKGDVYIDRTKAGQLLEGSVFGEGVRVGHFKRV